MLRTICCCLLTTAVAAQALLDVDYRHAEDHSWRDLVNTMSPLELAFTGSGEDRVFAITCRGSGWAIRGLPDMAAGTVHVVEVELRCRDQVERLSAGVRRHGELIASSSWPIDQGWATYRLQWRSREVLDHTRFELDLGGSGTVELRSLRLLARDAFIVDQGTTDGPDAGELIDNHEFDLGLVGWRRGWAESPWHFGIDDKLGTVVDGVFVLPHLADNSPKDRPLAADRNLSLRPGRTYHLRLAGQIEDGWWELKLVVPNTGWQPEVLRRWRIDQLDGEWQQTFAFEPPEYGQLREHNEVFPVLIAHGPGAHRLERFALSEGAPPAPAPSAVAICGGEHVDRAYLLGDAIPVQVRRNPAAEDLALQLELRGLDGELRWSAEVSAEELVVPAQPVGWYSLTVTGEGLRELPVDLVVVPDTGAIGAGNGFLGTHVRDLVWGGDGIIDPLRVRQAQRLGYRHYRWFQGWGWHEQEAGAWRSNETSAALLDDAGEVLLVLSETPKHRRLDGRPGSTQWPGVEAYAEATRRMLEAYPGRIAAVEVYNEPDLHVKLTPEDHAELCRATYAAVKAVDPGITVVAGAITTAAQGWLVRSIEAGMLDGCDVVSVHAYVRDKSAHIGARAMRDLVDPVRAAMRAKGQDKPIWDTESGFGVPDGAAGIGMAEVHVKSLITRQAAGIARHYAYAMMPKRFPDDGHFTYLIGHNGRPTITQPLVAVFQRLTGDATFEAELGDDPAGVHVYRWRDAEGRAIVAGWTSQADREAPWPIDTAGTVALDRFGQPVDAPQLGPQLVYLVAADDPKAASCVLP